jgi:hypothetical protein
MDINGIWRGTYVTTFDDQPAFLTSTFVMKITVQPTSRIVMPTVYFEGISQSDPGESHNTQHATVLGALTVNEIYFVKQYPRLMVQRSFGEVEYFEQPHPELHYSGKLEQGVFKGKWHCSKTLRKLNGHVSELSGMEGIWEMEKI